MIHVFAAGVLLLFGEFFFILVASERILLFFYILSLEFEDVQSVQDADRALLLIF